MGRWITFLNKVLQRPTSPMIVSRHLRASLFIRPPSRHFHLLLLLYQGVNFCGEVQSPPKLKV